MADECYNNEALQLTTSAVIGIDHVDFIQRCKSKYQHGSLKETGWDKNSDWKYLYQLCKCYFRNMQK